MASNRRAGVFFLKVNGRQYDAKGSFTYNKGGEKNEMIAGADQVHGYMSKVRVPFIEGEITDSGSLDLTTLYETVDATITLELANGKVFILRDAVFAADGDIQTEEGNIQVRFEGISADEVGA